MAKRKVVVKRLNAIQNLGSMDVLCTDKTGTLTQDHIILEHHVDASGKRDESALAAWFNLGRPLVQPGMLTIAQPASA